VSRATHLQSETVPTVLRFSNSSGNPDVHEAVANARALAVKFARPTSVTWCSTLQTLRMGSIYLPIRFRWPDQPPTRYRTTAGARESERPIYTQPLLWEVRVNRFDSSI
jgi:hypothetical protein